MWQSFGTFPTDFSLCEGRASHHFFVDYFCQNIQKNKTSYFPYIFLPKKMLSLIWLPSVVNQYTQQRYSRPLFPHFLSLHSSVSTLYIGHPLATFSVGDVSQNTSPLFFMIIEYNPYGWVGLHPRGMWCPIHTRPPHPPFWYNSTQPSVLLQTCLSNTN
jgi:hypothetical protein